MLRYTRGRLSVVAVCLLVSVPAFARRTSFPTTTALASSPNPSNSGAAVTLTATVTSTGGVPPGSVTFQDGTTSLATVSLGSSSATFTVTTLAAGTHSLTAVYGGSKSFAGSTSAVVTLRRVPAGAIVPPA